MTSTFPIFLMNSIPTYESDEPYDIIYRLIKNISKEEINYIDYQGWSPLLKLCLYIDDHELIEEYIRRGADINYNYIKDGWTPLHGVCRHFTNFNSVKILVENGARLNAKNIHGYTPLDYLCNYNYNFNSVELLLEYGAIINPEKIFHKHMADECYKILNNIKTKKYKFLYSALYLPLDVIKYIVSFMYKN